MKKLIASVIAVVLLGIAFFSNRSSSSKVASATEYTFTARVELSK